VLADDLSVRQVEELVRRVREPRISETTMDATPRIGDPEVERVEEDLRRALGTKVRLARTRRGGRIVIEYFGDDELARIYQRLVGGAE
jgi:ParB family chromosome partitioning protein